jgi:tetratricopeptide (TPR) repeat protein
VPATLREADAIVTAVDGLRAVHDRGHAWVRDHYLPALSRLADSRQLRHRRRAALAHGLLGDVHDLNGAPKAAMREYHKCIRLWPDHAAAWHAIGCMLDNMGRFKEARHALRRAAKLRPDDDILAGELERVEWAMLNPCPVLYEERSVFWRVAEELAAGHHNKALAELGRRRTVRARQLRARIRAVRGETDLAVREWAAIASGSGSVQLQHADWFYTFRGPVAEEAELWRLMLWKLRSRFEGGAFHFPPSLEEIELPEGKRLELYLRYELARCEGDVQALVGMAGKFPSWREPGEAALSFG